MRALEKEPEARFASASELALALAACSLAGKWTFGDATHMARKSSRPPPPMSGVAAVLGLGLGLSPPRVPTRLTDDESVRETIPREAPGLSRARARNVQKDAVPRGIVEDAGGSRRR